jgi:predicted MFS family arabinose efflux permease
MAALLGYVGLIGIGIQGGLIGPLVKRLGEGNIVRLGLAVLVVGYVLLTLPTAWGVGIFFAITFVSAGRSMIGPAATSLISRKTEVGQGLIQSTSQGFDALARTVGPVTAGVLFERISPLTPYYVAAVLTLGALAMTFAWRGAVSLPPEAEQGAHPAVREGREATAAVAAGSTSEVPL